ncbi:unnamed protein product [Mytilus coruscus]|uniref:SGNH hydrolase-type esterase domain-containing protein n=1 Tax=Mytilus coruscus TaxID=42192 RepID=A0A6J8D0M5_MYTCO|nr:unnamed protein product [Mytilus coruscus]
MKPQKRNRQPPNSLRSGAEKKATSKRKRPNVSKSHVHADPERPMAPRGNQNIIAAGSHSTQVMVNESGDEIIASNQNHSDRAELDPVTVAIPGPSSSRVLMSSTESLRPESHDVATTIRRRAADNDSSIVSQVKMVPSIQDSHDGDFVLNEGALTVVNKKPDSLNNIEIWTSAFMIYMAILLEKWPMKAQEYLKYMQSIRLASSRGTNNGWAVYDDQYRLKKERFPSSSWGVIDQELIGELTADTNTDIGAHTIFINDLSLKFSNCKYELHLKICSSKADQREPCQVWVMGSSIVYWAARSIKRRPGGQNLGLQSKGYNFHWYGQRGMKWKNLLPSVEENLRCYPAPQILTIHLGSNDLGLIKGKKLIEQIRLDIMRLHVLLPNLSLVWSEILPRRYWHLAENQVAINSTRNRVNAAVRNIFKEELNHGLVICHPNIKAQERDLFRHDGVHLSDVGNDVFLNNVTVQGALELFASSDRRVFPNR